MLGVRAVGQAEHAQDELLPVPGQRRHTGQASEAETGEDVVS